MNVETWVLALLASSLRLSAPLAIAALGELVAERSGVLNIGIEGMMLAGAFAAFSIGATTGSIALALLGSGLAGTALAALFATFAIARRADPIVTGAALNILALGATGSAYRLIFPPHAELPTAPNVADAALADARGPAWRCGPRVSVPRRPTHRGSGSSRSAGPAPSSGEPARASPARRWCSGSRTRSSRA
jgi:ABC-type uncharacterized transport system permease subunit